MSSLFWEVGAATVNEILASAVAANPDRTYCKAPDKTLSYAQMAQAVANFARGLGEGAKGRTVALVMPNSADFLISYFGVLAAGAAPALVNYAHPDMTVQRLLSQLDLAAVISDRQIEGLEISSTDEVLVAGKESTALDVIPQPDATGAILFSGGTTGLPKQIAHSHDVLVRKVERMEWGWPTNDGEVWLPVAPFTHVYGFLMGVLNPVLRGGTLVIPERFHPDLIVDLLDKEGITILGGGPPAIYQAIMASEKFEGADFAKLRVCPGGGAPFPMAVHQRWHKATGIAITEGYGMTEIAPICVNAERDGIKHGAAGKAVPDTVIEIVDIQTGTDILPAGETGEIRIKGPHLMTGYTGNPEETALALRDGYLYSGDIGMLDEDGFVVISDRKKDVIFVKGYNVFPREVEEALLAQEAVSGACVVGRSDARAGEVPVAYVTLRSPAVADEMREACRTVLASYKLPAEIIIMDALPMTPAAKVDRSALRAHANEAAR